MKYCFAFICLFSLASAGAFLASWLDFSQGFKGLPALQAFAGCIASLAIGYLAASKLEQAEQAENKV